MSAFTGSLVIKEIVPGRKWRLLQAIRYEAGAKGSGRLIEVPAGFETDGATIPAPLRAVLAVWGSYGRAACLHDYFYSILREGRLRTCDPDGGERLHPAFEAAPIGGCSVNRSYVAARRWADAEFYRAMRACGTSRSLAWLMWAGVRLCGGRAAGASGA